MIKDIEVTLYDIFGYLLPGCIALVSALILLWTICYAGQPFPIRTPDTFGCAILLIAAYYAGHFVHAIADQLVNLFKIDRWRTLEKKDDDKSLPECIKEGAKRKIQQVLKLKADDVNAISYKWLYRIADEVIGQCGQPGDREIFMNRVGFYRGSLVAFFMLWLSLISRIGIPITYFTIHGKIFEIPSLAFILTVIILLIGMIFLWYRYRKFVDYRVTSAVICFLALKPPDKEEEKKK